MAPISISSLCVLTCVADVAAHRSEALQILQHEVGEPSIADLMNSIVDKTNGNFLNVAGTFNCEYRHETDEDEDAPTFLSCEGPADWAKASGDMLMVAATVAASTGVGAPIAVLLSALGTFVKVWEKDGGGLNLHTKIINSLTTLQNGLEEFHFQRKLDEAEANADYLSVRIDVIQENDALEDCSSPIANSWVRTDDKAWQVMTKLLVDENSTVCQACKEKDVGREALRRRVDIINGIQNLWSTIAMDRLAFLTRVFEKTQACSSLQTNTGVRIRRLLLDTSAEQLHNFAGARKLCEASLHVFAVADIREHLNYFWPWSIPSCETYATDAQKLLQHGEPGRRLLIDLMIGKTAPWDRKSWVILALQDQLLADRNSFELLLPLAKTFAEVAAYRAKGFPWNWQKIYPGVKAARSVLVSLVKEHAEEVAAEGVEQILRPAQNDGYNEELGRIVEALAPYGSA